MRSKSALIAVVAVTLSLLSCGGARQRRQLLVRADSLMEMCADSSISSRQDSARLMLQQFALHEGDATEGERAYYALLRTRLAVESGQPIATDSLIMAAVDFFEEHPDGRRLCEAYYYAGCVHDDARQGEKALAHFQKALLEDSSVVGRKLKAQIFERMGLIYSRNELYEEAIDAQRMALYYYGCEGDAAGVGRCRETIAAVRDLARDDGAENIVSRQIKMMKVQRIFAQARSQVLDCRNARLQRQNARQRLRVWCTLAVALVMAGLVLMFRRRSRLHASVDTNVPSMAIPRKRDFYDAEVSQLLSVRLSQDKALKAADWQLIEARVLAAFPSFRDDLYALYDLSETEYHICLLIKLETSPSNMARLMATANSTISQSRLRMQQKVFKGEGTAKDWDQFVLSL